MNREDIDWSIIRGAMISVVLSLLISISLIVGSYYFKEEMNKEFYRNNALFMNISQRYLAIDEEEGSIRAYLPVFMDLYNKGVIGEEQRLNWIEVLKATQTSIRLPGLSYTINSQSQYTSPFTVNLGRFQLYSSEMALQLSLLHEGDLLKLLQGLDETVNGMFSVKFCRFTKSGSIVLDNPKAANLNVECELDWYIIKLADGTQIQV